MHFIMQNTNVNKMSYLLITSERYGYTHGINLRCLLKFTADLGKRWHHFFILPENI